MTAEIILYEKKLITDSLKILNKIFSLLIKNWLTIDIKLCERRRNKLETDCERSKEIKQQIRINELNWLIVFLWHVM